jgi:hypothetical protein
MISPDIQTEDPITLVFAKSSPMSGSIEASASWNSINAPVNRTSL